MLHRFVNLKFAQFVKSLIVTVTNYGTAHLTSMLRDTKMKKRKSIDQVILAKELIEHMIKMIKLDYGMLF
jgi:hypothetical protein